METLSFKLKATEMTGKKHLIHTPKKKEKTTRSAEKTPKREVFSAERVVFSEK